MNNITKIGEKTEEYSTGACRNFKPEGKGCCEQVPLDCASMLMYDDPVAQNMYLFMEKRDVKYLVECLQESIKTIPMFQYDNVYKFVVDSGIEATYLRDEKARETACLSHMMLMVSRQYEVGGKHFGVDSWKLGMPVNRYIDSAMRHYWKTLRGDVDEEHHGAFVWNVLCAMWTAQNLPELNTKIEPERVVPGDRLNK